MLGQEGLQQHGVMIAGIVEHHDHAAPASLVAQQLLEGAPKDLGVEYGADMADELPGAQIDRTEAGHGVTRRSLQQKRILVLRWHPHAAARPVLLEVTFVQAPQLHISFSSQAPQFFLLPRLSADRPERLVGAAYAAGSPSAEGVFGIVVRPSPHHSDGGDARRASGRPTAWRRARSPAESCADRSAACASISPYGKAVAIIPLYCISYVAVFRVLRLGSVNPRLRAAEKSAKWINGGRMYARGWSGSGWLWELSNERRRGCGSSGWPSTRNVSRMAGDHRLEPYPGNPRLQAYMDAPTLPSDGVFLASRYGLHPYIRTFERDGLAVPDGLRWSTPYRGCALGVLRLKRVSPTTV